MVDVVQAMEMRLALGMPSLFYIFLRFVFWIQETFVWIYKFFR